MVAVVAVVVVVVAVVVAVVVVEPHFEKLSRRIYFPMIFGAENQLTSLSCGKWVRLREIRCVNVKSGALT